MNEKRSLAINDLSKTNLKGFSIKLLLSKYPELFENKMQAVRYLSKLRHENETIIYERVGHQYLYFKKPDTYNLLTKLWA